MRKISRRNTKAVGTAVGLLAGLGGLAGMAGAQVPVKWKYQLQVRGTLNPAGTTFNVPKPSSLSSQNVSLDDDGSVVIRVILGTGTATEGIVYAKNAVGGLILTANNEDPVYSTSLDHRNGRIAVATTSPSDVKIYDTAGNLVQTYAQGGPEGVSGFESPTITNLGAIGYRATFGTGRKLVRDLIVGPVRTQLAYANSLSDPYSFLASGKINDALQYVARVNRSSDNAGQVIRFEADGSDSVIFTATGLYNSLVNGTAIAQNGTVAFSARRTSGSVWEVLTGTPGGFSVKYTGAQQGIVNSSLANFPPVVNSNGLVAFRATQNTPAFNSTALFVTDGTTLRRIVGPGDQLPIENGTMVPVGINFGGTTGWQILSGVIDINDSGQVAFAALMGNDSVGVYVATPVSCPADLNEDGFVDDADFVIFAGAYDQFTCPSTPVCPADLNGDGFVDDTDFVSFAAAYDQFVCP